MISGSSVTSLSTTARVNWMPIAEPMTNCAPGRSRRTADTGQPGEAEAGGGDERPEHERQRHAHELRAPARHDAER